MKICEEGVPCAYLALAHHRFGTVRIVERQHGGLRKNIRSAQARRVIAIALNLRGPTLVAFDKQPGGVTLERHRGCVKKRLAGNQFFRLAIVRHDRLIRRTKGTSGQPRKRERCTHQLEKLAAIQRVFQLRCLLLVLHSNDHPL